MKVGNPQSSISNGKEHVFCLLLTVDCRLISVM